MKLVQFAGAHRVPLVGRLDLLQEAERRIGRGGIHLLYFEGSGGIGKTALLEAILERSAPGGQVLGIEADPSACRQGEIHGKRRRDVRRRRLLENRWENAAQARSVGHV